jgi:hypothetical protein
MMLKNPKGNAIKKNLRGGYQVYTANHFEQEFQLKPSQVRFPPTFDKRARTLPNGIFQQLPLLDPCLFMYIMVFRRLILTPLQPP